MCLHSWAKYLCLVSSIRDLAPFGYGMKTGTTLRASRRHLQHINFGGQLLFTSIGYLKISRNIRWLLEIPIALIRLSM